MAIKKDAYWFSHDSNAKDDPKSMKLIDQLGLEGYGIYWVLIEVLRDQADFRYPMELLPILARRYNTSGEKMKAVVGTYGLFTIDEEDKFFSISLNDRMQILEGHREQRRIAGLKSAAARSQKQLPQSTTVERPLNDRTNGGQLSKVKYSKVKNNKVKESKEKDSVCVSVFCDDDKLIQKWNDWVDFRRKLKKPYKTDTGLAAASNKLMLLSNNKPETAISIINQSMENEWLGFFPLKAPVKNIPGEDMFDRQRRELKEIRLRREAEEKSKVTNNGN